MEAPAERALPKSPIPAFFLYGEAPRDVQDDFLHVEALHDRSRPNGWDIRPHAHDALNHLFHIARGGGVMTAEALCTDFEGPCLALVPAGTAHGFRFRPDSQGGVLTFSSAYLRDVLRREHELDPLFDGARVVGLAAEDRVSGLLARLAEELAWSAPGRRAAIDAALLNILVEALRAHHTEAAGARPDPGPQVQMVARFLRLIETHLRENLSIETYAERLHVTTARLRDACLRVRGETPMRLVHGRIILEAQRCLLYSDMSVAQTGYHLGLDDPAYFSRFFTRATGESPRKFRDKRRRGDSAPSLSKHHLS